MSKESHLINALTKNAILCLLKEEGKCLGVSDFVGAIPGLESRDQVIHILKRLEKEDKVVILKHPKKSNRYVFGLPE